MQIKAIQNFAHAPSCRSFQIGNIYEVTEKSANEFVAGGLAQFVTEPAKPETKAEKKAKE